MAPRGEFRLPQQRILEIVVNLEIDNAEKAGRQQNNHKIEHIIHVLSCYFP